MSRRRITTDQQTIAALLDAYRRGYFPMAECSPPWNPSGPPQIHWFSPDPRGILPITERDGLHVPRSLEKLIRHHPFTLRANAAFGSVIRACAQPRGATLDAPDNDHTWIDETLIRWYTLLHRAGHAHSIEAWRTDPATGEPALVGGIYGVAMGSAFFGESMFCSPRGRLVDGSTHPLDGSGASKVCLITLIRALGDAGFTLFDTQMVTAHVARFGGRDIPRTEYLDRLSGALGAESRWKHVRLPI